MCTLFPRFHNGNCIFSMLVCGTNCLLSHSYPWRSAWLLCKERFHPYFLHLVKESAVTLYFTSVISILVELQSNKQYCLCFSGVFHMCRCCALRVLILELCWNCDVRTEWTIQVILDLTLRWNSDVKFKLEATPLVSTQELSWFPITSYQPFIISLGIVLQRIAASVQRSEQISLVDIPKWWFVLLVAS